MNCEEAEAIAAKELEALKSRSYSELCRLIDVDNIETKEVTAESGT